MTERERENLAVALYDLRAWCSIRYPHWTFDLWALQVASHGRILNFNPKKVN